MKLTNTMEKKTYNIPSGRMFDKFYRESYGRLQNILIANFGSSLRSDELQDLCDDSFIDFYNNIREGKVTELTAAPFAYLRKICWNKAAKYVRDTKKERLATEKFEDKDSKNKSEIDDSKVDRLMMLSLTLAETEADVHPDDAALENEVFDLIENMPSPCAEVLHTHYWEGLKFKEIAMQFNFTTAAHAKTTASRCRDKFEKKIQELKDRMGYQGLLYNFKKKM